jgi:hypothetical protein
MHVQVIAMILGEQQAPWEDPGGPAALLSRVGRLRGMVLGLLQRDPASRTPIAHAVVACQRIMATSTGSEDVSSSTGEN